MNKVIRTNQIPKSSVISKDFEDYHYCDSFRITTRTHDSIDKITTEIFQTPRWADVLMGIRNTFFKFFGLDKGGYKKNINISDYYPIGSRAVYFTVIDRDEKEIVTAENDKHLNFRISIMTNSQGGDVVVHLTTLVEFNNFLGRFYFFFIKPFHRIIIVSLLKDYLKKTNLLSNMEERIIS